MSSELAMAAFKKLRTGDFEGAWEVFDELVEHPAPDPRGLNNALWAISDDNSERGVQPERARRYLAAAEPHGEGNPAIFYTGACLWLELGETETCLQWIEKAIQADANLADNIVAEPMFADLRDTPEFEAILERHFGDGIEDTDAGVRLLELAGDLGDESLVESVRGALARPPRTVEAIGFYPGKDDNDQERCYRFLVSQLGERDRLFTSQDKYSHWVFEDWAEHVDLPPEMKKAFASCLPDEDEELEGDTDWSDPEDIAALAETMSEGFFDAVHALEEAFEKTGKRLRMLWTGPGDTLHWIVLEPALDERWCGVTVVETYEGESLGVIKPDWGRFAADLSYALGIDFEPA